MELITELVGSINALVWGPVMLALILGVDRLLDMFRTAVNVTGDLTAASVMDRLVKSKT